MTPSDEQVTRSNPKDFGPNLTSVTDVRESTKLERRTQWRIPFSPGFETSPTVTVKIELFSKKKVQKLGVFCFQQSVRDFQVLSSIYLLLYDDDEYYESQMNVKAKLFPLFTKFSNYIINKWKEDTCLSLPKLQQCDQMNMLLRLDRIQGEPM